LAFDSLPSAASSRQGFTAVFRRLHELDDQKSHLMWVKEQVVDVPKQKGASGPICGVLHWHGEMHFRVKNLLPSLFCEVAMPQYVIEREIPGAGNLSDAELQAVARKSVGVLKELGPDIKWLHSYVTGDKVYCVYLAPDEETIREHARRGGFPANRISAVRRMIDPDTAN